MKCHKCGREYGNGLTALYVEVVEKAGVLTLRDDKYFLCPACIARLEGWLNGKVERVECW